MKNFLLILVFLLSGRLTAQSHLAVIVNHSVSADTISAQQLLDIYSLNTRQWDDGKQIVPVRLQGNESGTKSFYDFIGKKSLEMKKLWLRIQLSGEGMAPIAFSSDSDVIEKVASTRGAIGFVDSDKVTDKVKILLILP